MVHPLNDLKDARKARAELAKVKKAAGGVVTREELDEAVQELRAEFAAFLAPVLAALEIDDLDHAIDELDGLAPEGEPQEEPEP